MNCPECTGDSRMAVQTTLPWEGSIWRARKCPDCEAVVPTVERVAEGGWPSGIWSRPGKNTARNTRKGWAPPAAKAGRDDHFDANAGAELAGVMSLFTRPVAPAQHLGPD